MIFDKVCLPNCWACNCQSLCKLVSGERRSEWNNKTKIRSFESKIAFILYSIDFSMNLSNVHIFCFLSALHLYHKIFTSFLFCFFIIFFIKLCNWKTVIDVSVILYIKFVPICSKFNKINLKTFFYILLKQFDIFGNNYKWNSIFFFNFFNTFPSILNIKMLNCLLKAYHFPEQCKWNMKLIFR